MKQEVFSSPDYVRISRASAISLGIITGWMYKGAVNKCINLLLQYPEGCFANCAYCGLARHRPYRYEEKSFIHVDWPVYPVEYILEMIKERPDYVKRLCISMITNKKAKDDTLELVKKFRTTGMPLSVLVCPTVLQKNDLVALKDMGTEKIGIAIDLAKKDLFDLYRGRGVKGPHKWERYWKCFEMGLEVFGERNVGVHLMVGMGETEEEMVTLIDNIYKMGGTSHLFSFFAEKGSLLQYRPQPPWPTYLRVQLARYLIETGIITAQQISFVDGRIVSFGLEEERLLKIIKTGIPFMTTGCTEDNGEVTCNRPFGNCLPGLRQWNYPYLPDREEIEEIITNIFN